MTLTPQWGIRILIGTYYCVHLPLTRENSLANNNDWADQTEQLSVGNRDRMERTLGLTFLTFTSMADDKYFLLPTFAKNINHERREGHIKKQEIKDEESIWDDTATAVETAGPDCTHAYALVWPNPDDTHWSKLTRCWASGHRSTFPSQIPLCPAPNGRFLPEMEKSYGGGNKFTALHLVTVIPLCRENEPANVLSLTPVGHMRPDGGWSIRIMSVRSYRKIHAGEAQNS